MELYEITCDLIRLGVLTVEHKEGGTITTTGMVCDKIYGIDLHAVAIFSLEMAA